MNNRKMIGLFIVFVILIAGYIGIKSYRGDYKGQPLVSVENSVSGSSISNSAISSGTAMVQDQSVATSTTSAEKKMKTSPSPDMKKKAKADSTNKPVKNNKKETSKTAPKKTEKPATKGEMTPQNSAIPSLTPIENIPTSTPGTTKENQCILSIQCVSILKHMDMLSSSKKDIIPKDGVILAKEEVTFEEGDTVYSLLTRVCKEKKIHLDAQAAWTGYVKGIANIYEKDCGSESGWLYKVNDKFPSVGVRGYTIQSGDVVELVYSCTKGDVN